MSDSQRIDPALVAYLGAATALLKLWLTESQRAAAAFDDDVDTPEHPAMAPHLAQLQAIRATAATLPVPAAGQAAQAAFLGAMDQGLKTYIALAAPLARDQQKIAMLSGMENFALFDAKLARLEQEFGPFDEEDSAT